MPLHLDEALERGLVGAQHDGRSGHALPADDADLDLAAAAVGGHRREAHLGEVDVLDGLIGLAQDLAQIELDRLQVRLESGIVLWSKAGEKLIA